MSRRYANINEMEGKIFERVQENDSNELCFIESNGNYFLMYHEQDCCESVGIEDITGDLNDLVGTPILSASEDSNYGNTDWGDETWTFYNIRTIKGSVTIRWHGTSNGYYSTSVSRAYYWDMGK